MAAAAAPGGSAGSGGGGGLTAAGGAASFVARVDTGGMLSAISLSPDRALAAVGGRDVMKVVKISSGAVVEHRNLRPGGRASLNYSANDVKWHPTRMNRLATAAVNGAVVVWDLEKNAATKRHDVMLEHLRAANRIAWHGTRGDLLASGSQDGTVRLWDTRMAGAKSTAVLDARLTAVRDLSFDAFDEHRLAAAFESGSVCVWDLRDTSRLEFKLLAHSGPVFAMQFHPSRRGVLATGGRDRTVKVWDLRACASERDASPLVSLHTMQTVGHLQWRPGHDEHLASGASVLDNRIHVWHVDRPFLPVASFTGFRDVATGFAWLDGAGAGSGRAEALISCEKDGSVALHAAARAQRHHKHMRTTALAMSATGLAVVFDPVDRCSPWPVAGDPPPPSALRGARRPRCVVRVYSAVPISEGSGAMPPTPFVGAGAVAAPPPHRAPTVVSSVAAVSLGVGAEAFAHLALHYVVEGRPQRELCRHNARVRRRAGPGGAHMTSRAPRRAAGRGGHWAPGAVADVGDAGPPD